MKLSKFNHYYSGNKSNYIYNAFSNALCEVDEDCLNVLKKLKVDKNIAIPKELNDCGFVVSDEIDELDIISEAMYRVRMNTDSLLLTIAPTLGCNFKCPYCYENDVTNKTSMTKAVEDEIVEFVRKKINLISYLGVTWYGGEPLLKPDSIENMSKGFIDLCEENNVEYSADITTNGYLLDRDMYLRLSKAKISHIQIPLDGVKENHDRSRFLSSGEGSYEHIMENLLSLKSLLESDKQLKLPSITIRVNCTKANAEDIHHIVKELEVYGLHKYIGIYPAQVTIEGEDKTVLSNSEFLNLRKEFSSYMKKDSGIEAMMAYYPKRINACCGCDKLCAYVICPEGKLYKCWEDIGKKEKVVGDIFSGLYETKPAFYYKNMVYNPVLENRCRECNILPICMGGSCPIFRNREDRFTCDDNKKLFELNMMNSFEYMGEFEIKEIFL